MAIADDKAPSDNKVWGLFKLPFRNSGNPPLTTSSSASSHQNHALQGQGGAPVDGSSVHSGSSSVSSVARSLLPTRRRLRLDPANKLYFPYEPGKQVQSAIRIKNTSKSHVAFKVKGAMEYVPELFDEQKDQVAVEQILRALEKLKRQLAEAEAALEARKKPPEDTGPKIIGEGLVIDEW
ncbi:hypothetical protein RJ639_012682, partial [Escallonia herrerae]